MIPDVTSAQSIAQYVREDIRQVLADSWELQQLNRTAPKVAQATLDRLALPRRARIQQQVSCGLHDVCDFARWKAAQLAKQRAARQASQHEKLHDRVAQREALQGWRREKEQFGRHLYMAQKEQHNQDRDKARHTAMLATQQAKHDLQLLKEKQQKQRMHAAAVHERLAHQRMDTRLE